MRLIKRPVGCRCRILWTYLLQLIFLAGNTWYFIALFRKCQIQTFSTSQAQSNKSLLEINIASARVVLNYLDQTPYLLINIENSTASPR